LASSTSQGQGTYARPVYDQVVHGTVSESGQGTDHAHQQAHWTLAADGSWQAQDGSRTDQSRTHSVQSYTAVSDTDPVTSGAYFANLGGTGTLLTHESGNYTTDATSASHHTLATDGSWQAQGGTSTQTGTGSADQDFQVGGTYGHGITTLTVGGGPGGGAANGTWSVGAQEHADFAAQFDGTLGADDQWVVTGQSSTTGTGQGFSQYDGGGSAGGSTATGTGSSGTASSTSTWGEHIRYDWADTFSDVATLAAGGTVTDVADWDLQGHGGGGGQGSYDDSSSSAAPGSESSTTTHGQTTWSLLLTDTAHWHQDQTTTPGASPVVTADTTSTATDSGLLSDCPISGVKRLRDIGTRHPHPWV
jgi:hypothetical protein